MRLTDEQEACVNECIADVHLAFENLSEANTLARQAFAFERLSNAVHDLSSWHPKFNLETGMIEVPDE